MEIVEVHPWRLHAHTAFWPVFLVWRFVLGFSGSVAEADGDAMGALLRLVMTTAMTCNAVFCWLTLRHEQVTQRDPKLLKWNCVMVYLVTLYCNIVQGYTFIRDKEIIMLAINTIVGVQLNYVFCSGFRIPVVLVLMGTLAQLTPHVLLFDMYPHYNLTVIAIKLVVGLQNFVILQLEHASFLDRCIHGHRHRTPQYTWNHLLEFKASSDEEAFSAYVLRRRFTGLCIMVVVRVLGYLMYYIKGVYHTNSMLLPYVALGWMGQLGFLQYLVFGAILFVWRDRAMSDHHLCAKFSTWCFCANLVLNLLNDLVLHHKLYEATTSVALDKDSSILTGHLAEEVMSVSLIAASGAAQKYGASQLLHVPFTLIFASGLVGMIPHIIFFVESKHAQLFHFQLLLIITKMVPIFLVYISRMCFLRQFQVCKRIPSDLELMELISCHVTGFSKHRLLNGLSVGLAVILNCVMHLLSGQLPAWAMFANGWGVTGFSKGNVTEL